MTVYVDDMRAPFGRYVRAFRKTGEMPGLANGKERSDAT